MKYFVTVGDREVEVEVDGDTVRLGDLTVEASMTPVPGTPLWRLLVDGVEATIAVEGRVEDGWRLIDRGRAHDLPTVDARTRHIRSLAGGGRSQAAGGVVKAPMPGLVVRIPVAVGDAVAAGQGLVVLEAMKMENELKAPAAGVVTAVHAVAGTAVEKGTVLVEIGPA